jgi:hypothetical protein
MTSHLLLRFAMPSCLMLGSISAALASLAPVHHSALTPASSANQAASPASAGSGVAVPFILRVGGTPTATTTPVKSKATGSKYKGYKAKTVGNTQPLATHSTEYTSPLYAEPAPTRPRSNAVVPRNGQVKAHSPVPGASLSASGLSSASAG